MRLIIIPILLFFTISSFCQNKIWIKIDKENIEKVTSTFLNSPEEMYKAFEIDTSNLESYYCENLGFGYKLLTKSIGGGYAGIKGKFYILNDSIFGYSLLPGSPESESLKSQYLEWYKVAFNYEEEIAPVQFNAELINTPLSEYRGGLDISEQSEEFKFYFSLESKIKYGLRSGCFANNFLKNRKHFCLLKNNLSLEQLELLMYSKNPATRLTAIEFYLRTKNEMNYSIQNEEWINEVLENTGIIKTRDSCIVKFVIPKNVLYEIVNLSDNPYKE